MAQHTQFTPLRDSGVGIDLPNGKTIFVSDAGLRELIVRAVNSHDALVEALEDCVSVIRGSISSRSRLLSASMNAAEALRLATGASANKEAA